VTGVQTCALPISSAAPALRDFVLINAGAALVAWGPAESIAAGVHLARKSIDTGAAAAKLQAFIDATQAA